jgi:type II secretory pathway component PulF
LNRTLERLYFRIDVSILAQAGTSIDTATRLLAEKCYFPETGKVMENFLQNHNKPLHMAAKSAGSSGYWAAPYVLPFLVAGCQGNMKVPLKYLLVHLTFRDSSNNEKAIALNLVGNLLSASTPILMAFLTATESTTDEPIKSALKAVVDSLREEPTMIANIPQFQDVFGLDVAQVVIDGEDIGYLDRALLVAADMLEQVEGAT